MRETLTVDEIRVKAVPAGNAWPGVFVLKEPQVVNASQWMEDHLDCNTIMDDLGEILVVYAFVEEQRCNGVLASYWDENQPMQSHHILHGIPSVLFGHFEKDGD